MIAPRFAFFGLVFMALAAAGVTALGGGVDGPTPGVIRGHCVRLQGGAWAASKCEEEHAIPAADTPDGAPPAPALPVMPSCGVKDIDRILATIRTIESGGRYNIGPNAGGASGAYQYIDSTWASYDGYRSAYLAPADVQDRRAAADVQAVLDSTHDVANVPVKWYLGHIPPAGSSEWDSVPAPWAGNTTTPRQYQARWLEIYRQLSGSCQGGEKAALC